MTHPADTTRRHTIPLAAVAALFTVGLARAAAENAAAAPARAPYVGVAPGNIAVFDVVGEHGMEHEAESRVLNGKFIAVGYEKDGQRGVVTLYHPNKTDKVLGGCPITFLNADASGQVRRDIDYHAPIACTYLVDALFPIKLVPTGEGTTDVLQDVYALDIPMPVNLLVNTVPDRNNAGWTRSEMLARPSDPKLLPPGNSRMMFWEAKYDVDPAGQLALADNRYKLEASEQGNAIIFVNVRLSRASTRALNADEVLRLNKDLAIYKSIARDWILDRGRAAKSIDHLIDDSKGCVFASELPFLKQHIQDDIKRVGERDAWRYPKSQQPTTQVSPNPDK